MTAFELAIRDTKEIVRDILTFSEPACLVLFAAFILAMLVGSVPTVVALATYTATASVFKALIASGITMIVLFVLALFIISFIDRVFR